MRVSLGLIMRLTAANLRVLVALVIFLSRATLSYRRTASTSRAGGCVIPDTMLLGHRRAPRATNTNPYCVGRRANHSQPEQTGATAPPPQPVAPRLRRCGGCAASGSLLLLPPLLPPLLPLLLPLLPPALLLLLLLCCCCC
jgi:hypothetical protein